MKVAIELETKCYDYHVTELEIKSLSDLQRHPSLSISTTPPRIVNPTFRYLFQRCLRSSVGLFICRRRRDNGDTKKGSQASDSHRFTPEDDGDEEASKDRSHPCP